MAAELSTGVLALMQVYKRSPSVSMLVVKLEVNYFKKAVGRTHFICEDGLLLQNAVQDAITSGEGIAVQTKSVGKNSDGEIIAVFDITWSFKSKRI